MKKVVLAIKCFFFACLATLVYVACNDGEHTCSDAIASAESYTGEVQNADSATIYLNKLKYHCRLGYTDSATKYENLLELQQIP